MNTTYQLVTNVRGTRFLEMSKLVKCGECRKDTDVIELNTLNNEGEAVCMGCWNEKYED